MEANNKRFQELGLETLSSDLKNSLPQYGSTKGKTANKKTNSSDSDSSDYVLDDDDQGNTNTDSDDDEQPLAQQVLLLSL